MSVGYEETVCLSLFLLAGIVSGLHHQGPVSSVYTLPGHRLGAGATGGQLPPSF